MSRPIPDPSRWEGSPGAQRLAYTTAFIVFSLSALCKVWSFVIPTQEGSLDGVVKKG
jgi:hypothetical protein